MRTAGFLTGLALASTLAMATPAAAQDEPALDERIELVASGIAFFDEVQLGDLVVSPVNIFHDTRCEDPEFCFRNNQFAISVIMFTETGLEEVILRLFETTAVPGGTLTLTNTGTPPSEQNGAIELENYQLELVYRPDPITAPSDLFEEGQAESPLTRDAELPVLIEPARA